MPPPETVFDIGSPVETSGISYDSCKDRLKRPYVSGRRVETLSDEKRGRYLRVRLPKEKNDIAFDATMRTAAPHQKKRQNNGNMIVIKHEDIREKTRIGKVSVTCIFVVDISGSMGAEKRMESAKGAVMSLLEDAYKNRDKVALVAFKGREAEVVLPLCNSVDLAYKHLRDLPTGGKTPLAHGLMKGYEILLNEKKKKKDIIPILILITDGRANCSYGGNIKEELISISGNLHNEGIHTVIIDTESTNNSFIKMKLGYCREIAEISKGAYYSLNDLNTGGLSSIAHYEKEKIVSSYMS